MDTNIESQNDLPTPFKYTVGAFLAGLLRLTGYIGGMGLLLGLMFSGVPVFGQGGSEWWNLFAAWDRAHGLLQDCGVLTVACAAAFVIGVLLSSMIQLMSSWFRVLATNRDKVLKAVGWLCCVGAFIFACVILLLFLGMVKLVLKVVILAGQQKA